MLKKIIKNDNIQKKKNGFQILLRFLKLLISQKYYLFV